MDIFASPTIFINQDSSAIKVCYRINGRCLIPGKVTNIPLRYHFISSDSEVNTAFSFSAETTEAAARSSPFTFIYGMWNSRITACYVASGTMFRWCCTSKLAPSGWLRLIMKGSNVWAVSTVLIKSDNISEEITAEIRNWELGSIYILRS
jgi:hypothetical protein